MTITLAAFISVITVLVFFHELGHFLVARLFGVRVITFSIGFGPRIAAVSHRGIEYRLSAIPLGGYVKMATGEPGNARPDEYHGQSKWQRALIMAAGPAMNFVLAIVTLSVIALQGIDLPATAAGVARLEPNLWQAIMIGFQATIVITVQTAGTVRDLLAGAVSVRDLAGPIGIARIAGESARHGWMDLLALTTMLSVNLGVMNLLPVPMLDGGHIALTAIEGVRRRDFSAAMRRRILRIGFAVLVAVTATGIYSDLNRIAAQKPAEATGSHATARL